MEIEYNGITINVNIIGEFKLNESEYMVCSYEDNNGICKIIIVKIIRDATGIHTVDIPKEDVEIVKTYYEKIKKTLMEDSNG